MAEGCKTGNNGIVEQRNNGITNYRILECGYLNVNHNVKVTCGYNSVTLSVRL